MVVINKRLMAGREHMVSLAELVQYRVVTDAGCSGAQ